MPEILDDETKRIRRLEAATATAKTTLADVQAGRVSAISLADLDLALAGLHIETKIHKKMELARAGRVIGHSDRPILQQPPRYSDLIEQRMAQQIPGRISAMSGASANGDTVRVDNLLLLEMQHRGITRTEGEGNTLSRAQFDRLLEGQPPITKSFLHSTCREAGILPVGIG